MTLFEKKSKESKVFANVKTHASLDDKIVNTFSEFKNVFQKRCAYNDAISASVYAVDEKGDKFLLGTPGAEINDVEYIGGMWRVQNKFPYKITNVRGRDFVLMEKLPYTEKTKFDFYTAASVGENCYGYFCSLKPNFVVAKYETAKGIFYAYGQTREAARAFLGIKLYDEFQDLIHSNLNNQYSK